MKLTREVVAQIVRESEGHCIECNFEGPYKFFHEALCLKGFGLSPSILYERLHLRAAMLDAHDLVTTVLRCSCGSLATGVIWVAYHDMSALLNSWVVCDAHAYYEVERPHGFLKGTITKDVVKIQRLLFEALVLERDDAKTTT